VLVVALVFLVCFGVGLTAAANWLTDLAPGPVGGMAFLAVCLLLGAALAMVGLHTYTLIDELSSPQRGFDEPEFLATVLRNILEDAGTLLGLAAIIYLLAPPGEEESGEDEPGGGDDVGVTALTDPTSA
jgi:hypothetical protein